MIFIYGKENANVSLYIPVKIKTRFELFDGYGFAELIPTLVCAVLSGFIGFLVQKLTGGGSVILIVLIVSATSAISFAKGANNLSVVDQIRQFARFSRGQKLFKYRKFDEKEFI